MKLVEQELWQREEKGLIGILPVRDAAAESKLLGSTASQGADSLDQNSKVHGGSSDSQTKNQNDVVHWHNRYMSSEQSFLSLHKNLILNYSIACIYILTVH